jgi:hypothetical protein
MESLWTSRSIYSTVLLMGVWFLSLMMNQAQRTPLILRIGRHSRITRVTKSNTLLTFLVSHKV